MSSGWTQSNFPNSNCPMPPFNVEATSPLFIGTIDLRWDNPATLSANTPWNIVGVNVYRSDSGERGPYHRLNGFPLGGSFFRDYTDNITISREIIDWNTSWIYKGDAPNTPTWRFKTRYPIVKGIPGLKLMASSPYDVLINIDGVNTIAGAVHGESQEVDLISHMAYDPSRQVSVPPSIPNENSVVYVTYKTNINEVRDDLDRKIAYRVSSVGISLDGAMVETPLEYCQPIFYIKVESLDYIWREAVRRNNWILEQGGERVKLFIRKTSGQMCDCVTDSRKASYIKQPRNTCHQCFPPDTLVRTELGYRKISEIIVGEKVLSSTGGYETVTRVFENEYSGDMCKFVPTVSTTEILATPEHPIMLMRGTHQSKIRCGLKCQRIIEKGDGLYGRWGVRLLPSGRWWARIQIGGSKGIGTYESREEAEKAPDEYRDNHIKEGHFLDWDDAKNIKKRDWVLFKNPVNEVDFDKIVIPDKYVNKISPKQNGLIEFDTNDPDFLWVLGLYIAGGSHGKRYITISLHKDEIEYQNRVVKFFKKLGYNSRIFPCEGKVGNEVNILVYGSVLSRWLPNWVGTKCWNKKIPNEIMNLPIEKLKNVLYGIHDGDGVKSMNGTGNDRALVHTSEILALQVGEIISRLGMHHVITKKKLKIRTLIGDLRRYVYTVTWNVDSFKTNMRGRREFNGEILSEIRNVGTVKYNGKVYNLEVSGNHTYVVNGIVVHNCFGSGWVGGFEGPYDVIIAPDDSERKTAQHNWGRYVENIYEVWMGPTPLVTQRDFILKQSGEAFSIGPTRKPSNRGNILQQHFSINSLDLYDLRYRVPMDGLEGLPWPQTRTTIWPDERILVYPLADYGPMHQLVPSEHSPQVYPAENTDYQSTPESTEKDNVGDSREHRGRSQTWENITY